MRNFVDESGSFSWTPPGISLFAGLSIADRSFPKILEAFREWKRKIARVPEDEEVKGGLLRPEQLTPFVKWVVLPFPDFWVTLTGADTRATEERFVRAYVDQAAEVVKAAAEWVDGNGNASLARDYRNMARWLADRSPQNGLWMAVLSRGIHRMLQHTIVRHLEAVDDAEFESWEILIDRSFIHTDRHSAFWAGWLRSDLFRWTTKEPLIIPTTWQARGHPYVRRFLVRDDTAVMSDLFKNHMRFGDSTAHEGLQLADVCASICRRRFADGLHAPFELLYPRIVRAADGVDLVNLHLNEDSLRSGPPEDAIKFFDPPSAPEAPDTATGFE